MSRISNSKQYNDMCNYYESKISELESELNGVSFQYDVLCREYDELNLKYLDLVSIVNSMEDKLSQIETVGGSYDT